MYICRKEYHYALPVMPINTWFPMFPATVYKNFFKNLAVTYVRETKFKKCFREERKFE